MPANVVERFLVGSILIDGPREKLVEVFAIKARAREQISADRPWFRKDFSEIGGGNGIGRLIAPVETAISDVALFEIRIRLLIALQMVPAGKHDAPGTVNRRRKCAAGRVIDHEQIAIRRLQAP